MVNADSIYQRTLGSAVTLMGVGLHSGERSALTLEPAAENSGVRFIRKDVRKDRSEVIPRWHNVTDSRLCTRISNSHGTSVSTVEHLLAALRCCGVDNVNVVLDTEEVPIMDGSAAPFVDLMRRVGTKRQNAYRWAIKIRHPLALTDGDKFALVLPASVPRITVEIDFPDYCIGRQIASAEMDDAIADEIAPARTFGFADQMEVLKRRGLALGGSLRNAILVDRHRVINKEGLRFPDEFVRHKLLDAVGDLALAGAPIHGHLYAYKPGHALIQAFIKKLFAYPSAWSYQPMAEMDRTLAGRDKPKLSGASGRNGAGYPLNLETAVDRFVQYASCGNAR